MSTLELNGKDFATQTSSAEPVLASTVTGGAGLSGSTSLGIVTAGNLSNTAIVYPAGHVIQTIGDTHVASGALVVSTSAVHVLDANLEVAITCASTSNYLAIWLQIPNFSTEAASQGIKVGLRYSTDTFSSSDVILGEREWIDTYIGYFNGSISPGAHQNPITLHNWLSVPTTSTIKIRIITQALGGNVQIFGNSSSDACVGSLIVQEIQA